MKKDVIKDLVEKSEIVTSEGFTDKLMQHIELKTEVKPAFKWSFKKILSVMGILAVAVSFFTFKALDRSSYIFNKDIGSLKIPLFISVTIILLYSINYLLRLNDNYRQINND